MGTRVYFYEVVRVRPRQIAAASIRFRLREKAARVGRFGIWRAPIAMPAKMRPVTPEPEEAPAPAAAVAVSA